MAKNCYGGRWRNRPQLRALGAASMIFIVGGMDMAHGLGWNLYSGVETTLHFQFSWFVGFTLGAIPASFLIKSLPKMGYYIFSSILVLISGMIFASASYSDAGIITGRYISGIGVGTTTVAFIVHASEIAATSCRGLCTGLEQFGLILGSSIQIIYTSQWADDMDFGANRLHGILVIFFGFMALGVLATTIESPVFYLIRENEDKALELQCRLVRELAPTEETQAAFDELKCYVAESSMNENGHAIMPFLKLLIYRALIAMTFSVPINWVLQESIAVGDFGSYWPAVVYACLRFVGVVLAIFLLDIAGRKISTLLGLLVISSLMFAFAGIYADPDIALDEYYMTITGRLVMTLGIFAGFVAPSSSTFLSEAFPLRIKPYMIALCVSLEQIVHIIIICSFGYTANNSYAYFLTSGIIILFGFLYFGATLPETRGLTLREAQDHFRRLHDMKSY